MRARLSREAKFAAVVALLLWSIPAYRFIPFASFWGLDFQNLYAFHHCDGRNIPYLVTGELCGDAGRRDMFYPPLLYWSFSWVRLFSFEAALRLWAVFTLVGLHTALVAWIRRAEWAAAGEAKLGAFLLLLLFQFPVVFAVERANNDVLVAVGWTLAFLLFVSNRPAAAGFTAGLTTAAKLYPLFAFAVICAGLAFRALKERGERRRVMVLVVGYAAAGVLALAAFFPDLRHYLADELPRFSKGVGELAIYSHNLRQLAVDSPWLGWVVSLALFGAWVVAAVRQIDRDPALVFAGALAISTYFANTSYDYNLLTVFPLFVVLFIRATAGPGGWLALGLLIFGLLVIAGDRSFFAGSDAALRLRLWLQGLWLFTTGVVASTGRTTR